MPRGAWVAQLVKHLTSAQVILRFMSSSPASGSGLTARSLEPASESVSPSLSLPLPCSRSVSLSKINVGKKTQKTVPQRTCPCVHPCAHVHQFVSVAVRALASPGMHVALQNVLIFTYDSNSCLRVSVALHAYHAYQYLFLSGFAVSASLMGVK